MFKLAKRRPSFRWIIVTSMMIIMLYIHPYMIYSSSTAEEMPVEKPIETPVVKNISNQFNQKCLNPLIDRNVDYVHKNSNLGYWEQLSDKSIGLYTGGWKEFVEKEKDKSEPEWLDNRGIVFVAGNDDTMKRTVATIRLLRTVFNCDLDIEIWHLEKEAESVGTFQKEIDELRGIKLRDFSDFYLSKPISRSFGSSKQFQIKAAAIINSDFQHVLYLDSDNVPTRDPTYLFESREYMEYGAIFWPDFWKTDPENKIFRILEVECEDEWEQESGQIVVDKHRHWMPLQLTWYMQFFHDVYFRLLNGDKDTFQYAWRALKVPFYRVQTFVGMGGLMIGNQFCGHSMLQYPSSDRGSSLIPLFVHANLMKEMPKAVFMLNEGSDPIERPWRLIKRYVNDVSNTQLYPLFKMVNDPRNNITVGCMDFPHRSDENIPTYILPFDKVLPHFQKRYLESGGVGGK